MSTPVPHTYYRRPLPECLIAFESKRGKELFARGLQQNRMESYFPLASHFETQNEPAYCGLGTLVMCLNALKIDPRRVWKGSWRWYHQDMLDCCRSLSEIKEKGITLAEFTCLARCNGLQETTCYGHQVSFDTFRQHILECSQSEDAVMAISYSRKTLGQTGSGHFSPAGGSCIDEDGKEYVLILDVARFKQPSYWLDIKLLYDSMLPIDQATGMSRGYSILRPPTSAAVRQGLIKVDLNKQSWAAFSKALQAEMDSLAQSSQQEVVKAIWKVATDRRNGHVPLELRLEQMEVSAKHKEEIEQLEAGPETMEIKNAYSDKIQQLLAEVSPSPLYQLVASSIPSVDAVEEPHYALLATLLILALAKLRRQFLRPLDDPLTSLTDLSHLVRDEIESIVIQLRELEKCCSTEREQCQCLLTNNIEIPPKP